MSQLQHAEEDSQASGDTLHPSYNMLRKTHRPVETPCIPATTCCGRLTGQWRHPASQLQHAEEDSQASGDTLQTMSQLQHAEEDSQASGDHASSAALGRNW